MFYKSSTEMSKITQILSLSRQLSPNTHMYLCSHFNFTTAKKTMDFHSNIGDYTISERFQQIIGLK